MQYAKANAQTMDEPSIFDGDMEESFMSAFNRGGRSYWDDYFRLQYHYEAIEGMHGDYAKIEALAVEKIFQKAGEIYMTNDKVRKEVNSRVIEYSSNNPNYLVGRMVGGFPVTYGLSRGGGIGKLSSLGVGLGNLNYGAIGRGFNLIDQGIVDTVELMSRAIFGR